MPPALLAWSNGANRAGITRRGVAGSTTKRPRVHLQAIDEVLRRGEFPPGRHAYLLKDARKAAFVLPDVPECGELRTGAHCRDSPDLIFAPLS